MGSIPAMFCNIIPKAAGYQLIVLVGAQVMFGFDFTMGPAIWKDPALIGIAIMLLLYGSGKFGLDYRISKSKEG